MSAIILDTETTGTETTGLDKPQVIELGYIGPIAAPGQIGANSEVLRFKPSCAIELGAMATHHIIESDLAECAPWPGTWSPPAECLYLIGHNVDFDWKAIGEPKIKRICTLAFARQIWPKLDSHSLGALIYHLFPHSLARTMLRNAHGAGVDVVLCFQVLSKMLEHYELLARANTWEQVWQVCEKARVPTVFTFGKFKGTPISEVRKLDASYIRWCLSGKCDIVNDDPYWQKALRA